MKEMALKDIQNVSMDILFVLDEFCIKHKINYSLGYGALIGAIRHRGCIPWDDDIDIVMTRQEYDKFLKCNKTDDSLKQGGLFLYAPEMGNNYFPIARLCDTKRTKVYKYYQWTDCYTGIWIDIFVMDAFLEKKVHQIRELTSKCYKACIGKVKMSSDLSIYNNLKNIHRIIKYGRQNRSELIQDYLLEVSELHSEKSDFVCNLCSPYMQDIHRKEVFEGYMRVPFSDKEVSVITRYDEYLRQIYGDYMQLPPEDKRVRGHSANTYFWI